MRKLVLDPLPPRPDEAAPSKPSLKTDSTAEAVEEDSTDSANESSPTSAKPAHSGPHDRFITPEMKDWTPIYRVGHNLLIPTSLNNSALKSFILDTGAFTTTISPAAAREVTKVRADDRITVKGISGTVDKVFSADEITFRYAHISQKVPNVVAFESPQLSKNVGLEISGLIGITALGQTTMSIDYRDGLVKLSYDPKRGYHLFSN